MEEIVLAGGFRGLRVTEVATKLNASFATLYQLAPSKDELVALVVDRWYQRTTPIALKRMRQCATAEDKLLSWVRSGLEGASRPSAAFWEDVAGHATIGQLVATYSHYYVKILEAIITDGVRDGSFRPVNVDLVGMIWEAAGARFRDPSFFHDLNRSPRQMGEEYVDLILHGLVNH